MPVEPFKEAQIYQGLCDKEFRTWVKNFVEPRLAEKNQDGCSYYRLPATGDFVTINGLRRRNELNGVRAKVLSGKQDEFGRITVRIDAEGNRTMKIQPFRLVPDFLAPVSNELDKVSLRSECGRESAISATSCRPSVCSRLSGTGRHLAKTSSKKRTFCRSSRLFHGHIDFSLPARCSCVSPGRETFRGVAPVASGGSATGGCMFGSAPASSGGSQIFAASSASGSSSGSSSIFGASAGASAGSASAGSAGSIFGASSGSIFGATSGSSAGASAFGTTGGSAFGAAGNIFGAGGSAFGAAPAAAGQPSMFAQAFQQSRPGPGGARRRRR